MIFTLPDKIEQAISALQELPGVGRRTATRYVLEMLSWPAEGAESFTQAISQLQTLQKCSECGCFTEFQLESTLCSICSNEERKSQQALCVVEQFTDFVAIENANFFRGHYHLLGGVLNPMLGVAARDLRIDALLERLDTQSYRRLILAINPSVEGDVTCAYLADLIKQKFAEISVERIGFGMPIGGNLEYLDPLTISASFSNKILL